MTCLPRLVANRSRRLAFYRLASIFLSGRQLRILARAGRLPFAALCSLLTFAFSANLQSQQTSPENAQPTAHARHHALKPLVTGTDGSQTGMASFFGNFTTISAPSAALSVFRKPDCSLSLATGTYTIHPTFGYQQTELTANYERILHSEAQLTTTAGVFAKGCAIQPTPGFGSQPGVFVGTTTTGVNVFAGIGLIYPSIVEGVYILSGKSTFTLSSFQFSTVGNLATADLNKDGNGDLVVLDNASATVARVTVMLGNSDGTFQSGAIYPIAGDYSVAAVIDDVNGDGKLDIVAVSGDEQISVLLGNGDGTFQSAKSFAAPALPGYATAASTPIVNLITADVNGDGKKDIICSNGLVLTGNSDGTFTAVSTPAFPFFQDPLYAGGPTLASGDLNNDGKIDLAVNNSSIITTWIGKGDGTFTQGQSYATINTDGYIAVNDLDGDGNADIFVGLGDGGAYGGDEGSPGLSYALMGNGNGSLQGAPALVSGNYAGNNLVDLNGDGFPDLITLNNGIGLQTTLAGSLTVQLNNGKGGFTPRANIAPPASFSLNGYNFTMTSSAQASSFAVGDVNGDGNADVVFVDNGLTAINPGSGFPITYSYPVLFVAIGNGDGTFQTAVPYAFPQIAPAADFDNTNIVTNIELADVDHDGHNDLVFAYNETAGGTGVNPYNQGIGVLPGIGNGMFKAPVLTSTYSSASAPTNSMVPQIFNIGDLNGDNYPDLIVNLSGTTIVNFQLQTQLEALVGNGDGSFKTPVPIVLGADSYSTALTDLNKDGKLDLVALTESTAGQAALVIALGNGNGTFGTAAVSNLTGGDAIRSANLAAADFDGDGNVDLALLDPNDYSGVFYGKGDGTVTSINTGSYLVPKDLISIVGATFGVSTAVAADLNKDGRPDILDGGVSLINIYGSAPSTLPSTTTSLVASLNPIVVGTSVKFTATAAGPSGNTTMPTGAVTFMDGATLLGTGTLSAGVATYTTSALTAASHSITAVYSGDTSFSGSTSNTVTEVVNLATPAVTVTPSPSSITAAQELAVTVSVAATIGNGTPTGSVKLTSGTYTSAATTLTNGSAMIHVPAGSLAVGTDTLTATYTPDSGSSSTYTTATGTSSVTVTTAPTFTVSNGGNISVAAGAITGNTSTITVSPSNGFTGTVNFSCTVTTIPTGAASPATCGVTNSVAITGAGSQSGTLTVTTTSSTTPGAYAVTVTGISGSITQTTIVGVTVTANVPPPNFAIANSGSVTVTPGATTGNTSTITVTPSGGFTGSVALTAALTSSPSGASDLPTLSFGATSPVIITGATAGTGTLTVSTTAATIGALALPARPSPRGIPWTAAGGGATLACVLLIGVRTRRRRLSTLGIFILLALLSGTMASCNKGGGGGGNKGNPGTTSGSYTITVTGTSGSITQTATVNLTVN